MSTLEVLKRKIKTAQELQSVVKTMKALAAVSIRQYEKAVISLAEYNRTLEMGLQILLKNNSGVLLRLNPVVTNRLGLVVFGSDWGMCGQFNDRIANFTQEQLKLLKLESQASLLLTIGSRVCDRLEAEGLSSESCFTVPSSILGITPVVQEIVLTLEAWRRERQVNQIIIFYHRHLSSAVYRPNSVQIFPLNLAWLQQLKQRSWNSTSLPTYTMNDSKLAAALFRQHFFVSLYRACAESLASENASRLNSMQMAEKNIAERLNQLKAEFNTIRQTAITEELLDVVSGFEALTP